MSDAGEQPERDGRGGVFGVTLGLSLFAVAVLAAVSSKAGPIAAPAEVWAKHFQGEAAVSDFEFASAALLPGGREVVRLRRIGALPIGEEPAPVVVEAPGEVEEIDDTGALVEAAKHPEDDSEEEVDWSAIVEGERGLPPDDLVFIFYPRKASSEMFATYFQDLSSKGMGELGSSGGTVILESGELAWGGFSTNYVRQRKYEVRAESPRFVDSLRVNLSVGQSCVLIAIWPPGVPSGPETIEELLTEVLPAQDSGS